MACDFAAIGEEEGKMGNKTRTTETTAAGLAALVRYIVGASGRGELDPELVRRLCKRIGKEYEALLEAGDTHSEDKAEFLAAWETLHLEVANSEGKLLSKSLRRLRSADKERDAGAAT